MYELMVVTEEQEILGQELANAIVSKDADVTAAAEEAKLAVTVHRVYEMLECWVETKFAEVKRGLVAEVTAEINDTIEARLVKVVQDKIQEKRDDGSLKREMTHDIAESVTSQVDDQVNSWMVDIVRRKVGEETTKSDMASDIVGRVHVTMESRLDKMVGSKIKEKYAADDIVGRVQLQVEARLDDSAGSKIKENYAEGDILLRKILDDTK
ncbi:hypothetical protein PF003_g9882 [Phytophthora fragariae]|nr:hypothetical protein PF003_g9882 [Phytophthora fragariae]